MTLNLTLVIGALTWGLVIISAVFLIQEQRQFDYLTRQEVSLTLQKKSLPVIRKERLTYQELNRYISKISQDYKIITFNVSPLGYIEMSSNNRQDFNIFKDALSSLLYSSKNVVSHLEEFCLGEACKSGAYIWGKIALFNIKVEEE